MKKLILVAAVALSAAITQAATCSWSCSKVYTGNTTDRASGVAYFLTTDMAATTVWATLSGATAFTEKLGSAYKFTPGTAGTYSVADADAVANSALGLADATSYTGYLLIFDTATITDTSKFFVTSTADFTTLGGTSNLSITFGSQKDASQAAAGWGSVTTAAPEPTSGLLLLLGMAGLALKRKRA